MVSLAVVRTVVDCSVVSGTVVVSLIVVETVVVVGNVVGFVVIASVVTSVLLPFVDVDSPKHSAAQL